MWTRRKKKKKEEEEEERKKKRKRRKEISPDKISFLGIDVSLFYLKNARKK